MRPVLVALGLQAYDINWQITLHPTRVICQYTIYYCCHISCARLTWNHTRLQQRGMFHSTVWGTKAIHQEQDVNWLSIWVCVCGRGVVCWSSSREKLRALDKYEENNQSMEASGYQATGTLRQRHLHLKRPWYLTASVSAWMCLHPQMIILIVILLTLYIYSFNYSQLCQLIILFTKWNSMWGQCSSNHYVNASQTLSCVVARDLFTHFHSCVNAAVYSIKVWTCRSMYTRPLSVRVVSMMMVCICCSQTVCQKWVQVCGNGPWAAT